MDAQKAKGDAKQKRNKREHYNKSFSRKELYLSEKDRFIVRNLHLAKWLASFVIVCWLVSTQNLYLCYALVQRVAMAILYTQLHGLTVSYVQCQR
jgi:hypothetical protein